MAFHNKPKLFIWSMMMLRIISCLTAQNMDDQDIYLRTKDLPSNNSTFPSIGEDVLIRPIDQGMQPVYEMTKFFLNKVMYLNSLSELNKKVNLTNEDAVVHSLENDWELWIEHYISYTVAVSFAIIFILFVPLIGCIVCSCRKRGKCGGNPDPMDVKNALCQRIICNSLLAFFCTLILLGITSCFLCAKLVYAQTKPSGTMQDISNSLSSIELYLDNTQGEVWKLRTEQFDPAYTQIMSNLHSFPELVQEEVGQSTGAISLFNQLEEYASGLPQLVLSLEMMENTTVTLQTLSSILNSTLEQLKNNFTENLRSCTQEQCNNSKIVLETLQVTADFTAAGNLTASKKAVEAVTYGENNITSTIANGDKEYDQITLLVSMETNATIEHYETELEQYADHFYKFVSETIDTIADIKFSKAQTKINTTITKDIDEIGYYGYITLNITSSIALLILLLLIIALFYGLCGERAGEEALFCNRGKGTSKLSVAMVLFCLVSWILMLATTVMFLAGGLSYTELCHYLITGDQSDDIEVIDSVITSYTNMSGASAQTIMQNCQNDMTFYKAFEIEESYPELNITKILDVSSFEFGAITQELLALDYNIGPVLLLNNATISHLDTIEQSLSNIDIISLKEMSTQNITNMNLVAIAAIFNAYAQELNRSHPVFADLFILYSERLMAIYNGLVLKILDKMMLLKYLTATIEKFDQSMNTSVFIPQMKSAQEAITNTSISNAVNKTAYSSYVDVLKLSQTVEISFIYTIGRCYSVYNAISVSISSICVLFLYPFNGFWFSMGWNLFFLLLIIPVALVLVTLYGKTVPYIPTHDLIGRPNLHRKTTFGENDNIRAPVEIVTNGTRQIHFRTTSYQDNNHGYDPDYSDDEEIIVQYHCNQDGYQLRGQPNRPTTSNSYVLELQPTAFQQHENGAFINEDYF